MSLHPFFDLCVLRRGNSLFLHERKLMKQFVRIGLLLGAVASMSPPNIRNRAGMVEAKKWSMI
jgi:hypothetical protein